MIRLLTHLGLTNLSDEQISAYEDLRPAHSWPRYQTLTLASFAAIAFLAGVLSFAVLSPAYRLPTSQDARSGQEGASVYPLRSRLSKLEASVPSGPTPQEIQAQIDTMFDAKVEAMEANLKSEYDQRIAQMQRQLEDAQKAAAERSRRLEEAELEAEAARTAASERDDEASTQLARRDSPKSSSAGNSPALLDAPASARPAPADPAASSSADAPSTPSVRRGDLVDPGPGVSSPQLILRATPQFPPVAAQLNREATVDVRVLVSETGTVLHAAVESGADGFGFAEAAIEAAKGARFRPATKFEIPVKMWTTLRFVFRNSSHTEPEASPPPGI